MIVGGAAFAGLIAYAVVGIIYISEHSYLCIILCVFSTLIAGVEIKYHKIHNNNNNNNNNRCVGVFKRDRILRSSMRMFPLHPMIQVGVELEPRPMQISDRL
jgi:hypothetical protein